MHKNAQTVKGEVDSALSHIETVMAEGGTLESVADEIGVDHTTVSRWRNRQRSPTGKNKKALLDWARRAGAGSAPRAHHVAVNELQMKANKALQLFREGQELLSEVVSHIQRLPISEDEQESMDAADSPMPGDGRSVDADRYRQADGE